MTEKLSFHLGIEPGIEYGRQILYCLSSKPSEAHHFPSLTTNSHLGCLQLPLNWNQGSLTCPIQSVFMGAKGSPIVFIVCSDPSGGISLPQGKAEVHRVTREALPLTASAPAALAPGWASAHQAEHSLRPPFFGRGFVPFLLSGLYSVIFSVRHCSSTALLTMSQIITPPWPASCFAPLSLSFFHLST